MSVSFFLDTLDYTLSNKLINASSSLGKSIDYVYYEDGNLGFKTSQDTTKYIYDGIHCIAKYDQDNNLINEIVYGPQIDEVLCSIDSSDTAHYYHQDTLQSVVAITDGFANKSAVYEYDVYGKIKDKTGSFDNEITYTGRWLDEDTGLYYYRARWYDADNGRFISRDPIGTRGGINLYGYVGNGPVNKTDPLGLEAIRFNWVPCNGAEFDYCRLVVCQSRRLIKCMAKLKISCGLDGTKKRERMFPPSCHCEDYEEEDRNNGKQYDFNPGWWTGFPFIPILGLF